MLIKHSCPTIGQTESLALRNVLRSTYIAKGKIVHEFENGVIKYLKAKNMKAVAVNSGSSALHLALLSLGISSGDEVIIPSYVCSAVLNAVNYTGAKPILVDVNEDDFNINIEHIKNKITKHTRAIILVHLYGLPAQIDLFIPLKIPLIEDCAQSIGATYKNRPVGTSGKLSTFSFYATKMLTTAHGGMVLSKDNRLINNIRNLVNYDERDDYIQRYNYQMTDLEASLGLSQVKQLDNFIQIRRSIASRYQQAFQSLNLSSLIMPKEPPNTKSVFCRYVIRHPDADKIILQLNRHGIEAKRSVYKPLHHYLKLNNKDFPVTERIHRTAISIPIYPSLTNKQINYIIHTLFKILKRLK